MNLKGTREKKLQEGLKKIKGTIKLKKPKKLVRNDIEGAGGKEDAEQEGEDVEMADDNDSKQQEVAKENDDQMEAVDKNHLFENDQYEQVLINAVWYSKHMPKKRKNADYAFNTRTRGRAPAVELETAARLISLESIKSQLLEIEALYSSTMSNMQREWETPETREQIIDAIQNIDEVAKFYRLMSTVEEAFCSPW